MRTVQADSGDEGHDDGAMKEAVVTVLYKGQGVIRYHPARPRKEGREQRKKMAVLEINDWDDSVTSCLCGKKGERTEKRSCVEKTTDQTSHTPDTPTCFKIAD